MKIKVAYDVCFPAAFLNRVDSKTGIYRVTEEVLRELGERDDVEMTVMCVCGFWGIEDPLKEAVNSFLYFQKSKSSIRCKFTNSFKSRLGLADAYVQTFSRSTSGEIERLPKSSLQSIYLRGMRSLLYRLYFTYKVDSLERHFRQRAFDLFHSPFLKLPSKQLTGNIPRVLTVYDLIPIIAPHFVVPEQTFRQQEILNSVDTERDWITCISEYTKQEFCDYTGMSPERVFVTPLAAADHFYPVTDKTLIAAARQRYAVPPGDYLLSIAAPQPRKNLEHLIRCFHRLLTEQPTLDVSLVLVGSMEQGWMYEELLAAANSSSELGSRVVFTGYVPDEDLSAIYSGAKAFVFPSLYEGFGLPLLEAMQCGVPVITSNTTSIPEVAGDASIMVDPTDSDALCQAMLSVLSNSVLHSTLSQRGFKQSTKFSWAKCAAETVEVYRKAINGS